MTAGLRMGTGLCGLRLFRHWRIPISPKCRIPPWQPLVAILLAFTLAACGTHELNVVVFNYWPRPMAHVYVDGQHVGAGYGEYGPGGTGAKISCCSSIRVGKTVEIKWMLDGPSADPLTGKIMQAKTELKEIKSGARYLGVYLYPDGCVALDTARGIPDDRLPPEGK